MMPQNQLIFNKSDSVRLKTKECKNLSHTLKLKSLEVLFIKDFFFFNFRLHMCLNSYEKLTLMDLPL
jgi:hypothetical protein